MSTHLGAAAGQIAPVVLMPGDPLRARWIAETFLDGAVCHNEVRGMLGYTGTWNGHPVSVQGSGMGQPSMAIYATELCADYGATTLIRVGSCGALSATLAFRDLVIASGACTDSSMNRQRFDGLDYAPVADFGLLRDAAAAAPEARVGLVFSSDQFYAPRADLAARLAGYGVLAVEMEASALYTIAAQHGARALAICTVSDHMFTGEAATSHERERTFGRMVEVALAAAFAQPA